MYSISDYIGNKIPIPETIAGVKVNADGSFVLTRQDVEKYYKCRFDDFKKLASEVSMQTFCSSDLYDIQKTIEKKLETYVVLITDSDDDNYFAETLDSFLRETYRWFDECERQTFYVVAAADYHW